MSSSETSPTSAKEPFDNIDADIVLRSSDNVDFRVFKLILSLASPVLKSMFTLPQQDDAPSYTQSPASPPVISISESSATLEALLLLCYPATTPTFSSVGEANAVVEAATKYDMTMAVNRAAELISLQYLESSPLAIYAISCRFGWRDLAQRAATQTLNIKALGRPSLYVDEMEHMTAGAYHRLLAYHLTCGGAAKAVGGDLSWVPPDRIAAICNYCANTLRSHTGLSIYLHNIGEELFSRPSTSTILSLDSLPFKTAVLAVLTVSTGCKQFLFDNLEKFRHLLAAQVQKAISEVELEFKF